MPSASEIVRVIGGGGAWICGIEGRGGRRFRPRIGERQRLEQDRVHDAEDARVRSDGESEREDRHRREARRAPK